MFLEELMNFKILNMKMVLFLPVITSLNYNRYSMKNFLLMIMLMLLAACGNNTQNSNDNSTDSNIVEQAGVNETLNTEASENIKPNLQKYTWEFGMCEYTGTFDANKYTKEQFKNTIEWLLLGKGTTTSVSIFKIEDLGTINQSDLEKEFAESLQNLNSLEFVGTPFFIDLKKKRINEIERQKLLTFMQIESYKNPKVLNNDSYSKNNCGKYTSALIKGGDALLAAWKEMAEKWRNDGNSSAWERYNNEYSSANKLDYARVSVTTFGWWNCVNESIERVDGYVAHDEQFVKLFNDVKKTCEEP